MRETIELGPTPVDVNCAQLGTDDYEEKARAECSAYVNQLRRLYEKEHGHPPACSLRIKANSHDFGTYYEVAVSFNDDDKAALASAMWLENNLPAGWDGEAERELGY